MSAIHSSLSIWVWTSMTVVMRFLPARHCRLADGRQSPRPVLRVCAASAAALALCYAPAHGLWKLLVVGILQAASLAPLAPLADTLALGTAASPHQGQPAAPMIDYGSVRGTGSAAFLLVSPLFAAAISPLRIRNIVLLNGALLAA